MKFLKQASMLRLCVAIGMMIIGIAGCQPKITSTAVYYTVILKVASAEGGTLKTMINSKLVETGSETNIPVLSGTKIKITAHPSEGYKSEGYKIESWASETAGAGTAAAELVITKDSAVSIEFIKQPANGGSTHPPTPPQPQTPNPSEQTQEYTLTFNVKNNIGGMLTATAGSKTLTNNEKLKAGTKVRFTATPKSTEGYTVGAWAGTDAAPRTGAVELIITQDVNVTVAFVKRQYTITFDASEGGSISAKVEEGTDNLSTGDTAPYGSTVTFTAVPEEGYIFDRWEGLTASSTDPTASYTVTGDRYVKACFKSTVWKYLTVNEETGRIRFFGAVHEKQHLKGKFIIPTHVYNLRVTDIEKEGFKDCKEITEVVLPKLYCLNRSNISTRWHFINVRTLVPQGFRIITPAILYRGNLLVCCTGVAYGEAAFFLLLRYPKSQPA